MASIRRKLIRLVYLAIIPLVIANGFTVVAHAVWIWRNAVAEVEYTSTLTHGFIESILRERIVSYLTAKLETALQTIENHEQADLDEITTALLDIRVAEAGYVYVIDAEGSIVIHPDPELVGQTLGSTEPVVSQLHLRSGYLEYTWQNTFEPSPLPKGLVMGEYDPRSWIVAATTYRSEFVDLIDHSRLADSLMSMPANAESYSVVIDRDGNFVVHPRYRDRNLAEFQSPAEYNRIMNAIFGSPSGRLRYSWPPPGGGGRPKIMIYRYLPDFDWVVATTVYLDTLRRPTIVAVLGFSAFTMGLVAFLVILAMRVSRSVADPLAKLAASAEREERYAEATRSDTPHEIGRLVRRFNQFVDRIERQRREVATREESLEKIVHEKTVLIREIHHRVKNNLQVISSLLNLQSGQVIDPRDAALFERSSERVASMALVHEQLHQTDDLSLIPFGNYLNELVANLIDGQTADRISITIDCDDSFLEIFRAVPCGLIVNELVSNAIEHAFPDERVGQISITFARLDGSYFLAVGDDGVGFSGDTTQSLGLTLVETLARQLGAILQINAQAGTLVELSFSATGRSSS